MPFGAGFSSFGSLLRGVEEIDSLKTRGLGRGFWSAGGAEIPRVWVSTPRALRRVSTAWAAVDLLE